MDKTFRESYERVGVRFSPCAVCGQGGTGTGTECTCPRSTERICRNCGKPFGIHGYGRDYRRACENYAPAY